MPALRADTGNVHSHCTDKERDMTFFAIIAKGIVMIALAGAAFIALAIAIGYEPAAAKTAAQCEAKPAPACLFMIL